jgi:hypothetical protein
MPQYSDRVEDLIQKPSYAVQIAQEASRGLSAGLTDLVERKLSRQKKDEELRQLEALIPGLTGAKSTSAASPQQESNSSSPLAQIGRGSFSPSAPQAPAGTEQGKDSFFSRLLSTMKNSRDLSQSTPKQSPLDQIGQGQAPPGQLGTQGQGSFEQGENPLAQIGKANPLDQIGLGEQIQEQEPQRAKPTFKKNKEFNLRNLTDSQLLKVHQINPEYAKILDRGRERQDKKDSDAFSLTKEARSEIIQAYKDSLASDMKLNRILEIDKEGDVINPIFSALLDRFGLDLAALKGSNAAEIKAIGVGFLSNLKSIFGTNVSDREVKIFVDTLPTLSQTKDGRERIARNLQVINQASQLRYAKMKEIVREHDGVPPKDLEELVEEGTESEMNGLARVFAYGAQLPKPNRYTGETAVNSETGEKFTSNGQRWLYSGIYEEQPLKREAVTPPQSTAPLPVDSLPAAPLPVIRKKTKRLKKIGRREVAQTRVLPLKERRRRVARSYGIF